MGGALQTQKLHLFAYCTGVNEVKLRSSRIEVNNKYKHDFTNTYLLSKHHWDIACYLPYAAHYKH